HELVAEPELTQLTVPARLRASTLGFSVRCGTGTPTCVGADRSARFGRRTCRRGRAPRRFDTLLPGDREAALRQHKTGSKWEGRPRCPKTPSAGAQESGFNAVFHIPSAYKPAQVGGTNMFRQEVLQGHC